LAAVPPGTERRPGTQQDEFIETAQPDPEIAMTRLVLLALLIALPPVAQAQARQACLSVTSTETGWGSRYCVPVDRPRGLPARLHR